jgi:hypothetical protein
MSKVETYAAYSENYDMTFIVKETITDDNKLPVEVTGFYYGEPNDDYTRIFDGKRVAELEI